ncbi:T9SS type A sorting domain-containing protein [Bizionia hallyeonensis]|uniref:T9SS type A sorting domain-containing protein n=1 Tax=Bizionia hallyeonensis TaxID=1123757 RepID=A0ABW0C712_9FLAO
MKKNYILFLLAVTFVWTFQAQTVITQSVDPTSVTDGGVACGGQDGTYSENSFYRSYNMTALGVTDDFEVTSVEFGQGSANDGKVLTLNLYTASAENLGTASLTLLASTTHVAAASDDLSVVSVALSATIPAGSIVALEVNAGDSGTNINETYYPGFNAAGENAPSYLKAVECGITVPTTATAIGYPDNQYVMNIVGNALSIDEFSLNNISVSPNPAQNYIHINFPQSVSNFSTELYDIAGKLVLKSNNIERLNIGKLHAGVYILKVATDTGSVTKRIIKS